MINFIIKLIFQDVLDNDIYDIGKLAHTSSEMYQIIKYIEEREDNLYSKKLKILTKYSKYPNKGMEIAVSHNYQDLIDFYIKIGANLWNVGIKSAAEAGNIDLIHFFLRKIAEERIKIFTIFTVDINIEINIINTLRSDIYLLNMGLLYGAKGGHLDIVKFFIENGANEFSYARNAAIKGGHQKVVEYLNKK